LISKYIETCNVPSEAMKTRYTTIDIKAILAEIRKSDAIGLRVLNVYDIDNKTYLIRLSQNELKFVLLIEAGNRIHLTDYDWPKNMMPSGFAMKCRKHIKGRRLASIQQLGIDRIVDMQFGYDDAAYHLIVELYDRGNVILTDHEYSILQLLRVRTDTELDVKFAVRERYPVENARQDEPMMARAELAEKLLAIKQGDQLKRALNSMFVFGPVLLEHCFIKAGLNPGCKIGNNFDALSEEDVDKLYTALVQADKILRSTDELEHKGFIIQKQEKKVSANEGESNDVYVNTDFHPFLYHQNEKSPFLEFPSFNKAVDEFFSQLESQKIDVKALNQEKTALKKLENVRKDHERRLQTLQEEQDTDKLKAELIELNLPLVDQAIRTINCALANQISWDEIGEIIEEERESGNQVANTIKTLKLESNQIVVALRDPYDGLDSDSDGESNNNRKQLKPVSVEIDLSLTAFANARQHHDKRRYAANKEQKTVDASKKALKSAERKTKETLKDVQTAKVIQKARKRYWFEKFFWFISSENFLVVAGRDQQQNEMVVKRYLKPGDIYVHADLHGASSVVIKNNTGAPVPPKTLNEAGTMAICYSAAWEAKVVTSAWWVYHDQVSKTAPSGEYLTTGSFMIRGKKNFLPPSYLIMGFGILFKLDESSVANHANDRKVRSLDDAQEQSEELAEHLDDIELMDIKEEDENELDVNEKDTEEKGKTLNTEHDDVDRTKVSDTNINLGNNIESTQTSNLIDKENEALNELQKEPINLTAVDDRTKLNKDSEAYPDTSIDLQYVSSGKYELHRGTSSSISQNDDNDDFIDLGDGRDCNLL